jgi:hypothetical protein
MYHKGAFESMTRLRVNCVSKIVNAYLDSPSIRPALNNRACPDNLNQIRTIRDSVIPFLNQLHVHRRLRHNMSNPYPSKSSNSGHMAGVRITIPNNVVEMSCYRSSQRLFTAVVGIALGYGEFVLHYLKNYNTIRECPV